MHWHKCKLYIDSHHKNKPINLLQCILRADNMISTWNQCQNLAQSLELPHRKLQEKNKLTFFVTLSYIVLITLPVMYDYCHWQSGVSPYSVFRFLPSSGAYEVTRPSHYTYNSPYKCSLPITYPLPSTPLVLMHFGPLQNHFIPGFRNKMHFSTSPTNRMWSSWKSNMVIHSLEITVKILQKYGLYVYGFSIFKVGF